MSYTQVTYNGFTMNQVHITDYSVTTEATANTPGRTMQRHRMSGEAIINAATIDRGALAATSPTSLRFQKELMTKLNMPRRPLVIEIDMDGTILNRWTVIDTLLTPDESSGPFFSANITTITGTSTLMIQFVAEWSYHGASVENMVKSFYMNATFSIDDVGATTIRKTGMLEMVSNRYFSSTGAKPANAPLDRAGTSNTATLQNTQGGVVSGPAGDGIRSDVVVDFVDSGFVVSGSIPDQVDYYRRWIAGNLYKGFRRVRQEFAVDESRNRLMFDVTDQEFFRGLPAPARVGNCQYTFERGLDEDKAIGIKHFVASVKGDKDVPPSSLLTLCVRLSQNRIDYKNDLIVKIRVTEENMLSENAITYEVAAKATSNQAFSPSSGTEGGGLASQFPPMAEALKNILSTIPFAPDAQGNAQKFVFVPSRMPDAYGRSLIARVSVGGFSPETAYSDYTTPTTLQWLEQNPVVYEFPDSVYDAIVGQQQGGELADPRFRYVNPTDPAVKTGPNQGDMEKTRDDPNPSYFTKGHSSVRVHTGIINVQPVCAASPAKQFQITAPHIEQRDEISGAKKNEPPQRLFNDKPTRSVVSTMDYNVSSGHADLNGNRILVSNMTREMCITPPSDLPSVPGPSPTDPAWQVVTRTINGEARMVVEWNPQSLALPPDQSQKIPSNTNPSYTAGLTTETYLA